MATDDELLSLRTFDFKPTVRTVTDVTAVGALGDDTFMAASAHGIEHAFAVVNDMAGELRLSPGSRVPSSASSRPLRARSGRFDRSVRSTSSRSTV